MPDEAHSDVKRLPFERAIEELESIVKRLEEGKVPLEESVAIYERGEALTSIWPSGLHAQRSGAVLIRSPCALPALRGGRAPGRARCRRQANRN